ncbi:MAG: Do family serine endopeptidase [Verrucomicrobiota bacterium]
MKLNRTHYLLISLVAFLLGFQFISIAKAADWWPFSEKKKSTSSGQAEVVINNEPLKRDSQVTTSFADVVELAAPSVVSIKTEVEIENRAQMNPFLREFFNIPENRGSQTRIGAGSGVVVSKDGYILTNNHVVDRADEIIVEFQGDPEEYEATIVGTDPATDLAVLKIDRTDIPAAVLGDSDMIRVGDIVLAIGNPFGLQQTVTMGIISATGRELGGGRMSGTIPYQDFIQTDAAINQGNSGGALVDAEGRLVGINSAIFSRTGENLGIGFAIPINLAHGIMTQLIETGRVSRGYLGVMPNDLDPDNAEFLGLEGQQGVHLTEVVEGTPAAKAGLKADDVVLEVDGKPVPTASKFRLAIASYAPGSEIAMKVYRDEENITVKVKLEERPDPQTVTAINPQPPVEEETGKIFKGITIADIDNETRRALRIPEDVDGAVITEIDPDSKAAETDLAVGMVIMEISTRSQTKTILSAQNAIDFSRAVKADIARLRVWHQGFKKYIVLKSE